MSLQKAVVFDESRWPLLVVEFVALIEDEFKGERGNQHAREMNTKMLTYFARKQRFGMVLDFSRSNSVSSTFRSILAKFEKEHAEAFSSYMVADALVLASALQRGAFTAYSWIAPMAYPTKPFELRQDAIDWITHMIETDGKS